VRLYKDNSWSSESYTFNVNDYVKDHRQSISGSSMHDRATWLAFNLPAGTVVTMMTHYVAAADGNVYNLKNCGPVVDLVGTGQTDGVDLTKIGMNDCISAWYWHKPRALWRRAARISSGQLCQLLGITQPGTFAAWEAGTSRWRRAV
jgi:hypothetical protein